MTSSINNRVRNLECSCGPGKLIAPAPDGSLPNGFIPYVDGVDLSSVKEGIAISWKGEPLNELALIFGPNPMPHEEALKLLDDEPE